MSLGIWKLRKPKHSAGGHTSTGPVPPWPWVSTLVFQALLWGALRTASLLNLLNTKKLHSQEEAETILPAGFYNENDLHPLLHFCHGKWQSGSLKTVNDPLWATAWRASQLALRTSSLKAMAQVLPRPEGDCQGQKPPSQEGLLQELPWKWRHRQGHTHLKAARTERQFLRSPNSLSFFFFFLLFFWVKSSYSNDQESSRRETLRQTLLTIFKGRS